MRIRQYRIYVCSSCLKTLQMMMDDSIYLDEPRMYSNGISWVHVGVYFGILWFRIRYEWVSQMHEGLSFYEKGKHFEYWCCIDVDQIFLLDAIHFRWVILRQTVFLLLLRTVLLQCWTCRRLCLLPGYHMKKSGGVLWLC